MPDTLLNSSRYDKNIFMILTLHKLVHMHDDDETDIHSEDGSSSIKPEPSQGGGVSNFIKRIFSGKPKPKGFVGGVHNPANDTITGHTDGSGGAPIKKFKTIQRYHGGNNEERMQYLEKHSALTNKGMAVSAEQVSIFLTNGSFIWASLLLSSNSNHMIDNTVISFFESSADDLETPILHRLSTPDTILRRSCDASMLLQALIDAIIDLAMPVTEEYENLIGELELNVLMEPSIKHASNLYIVTTEITKMRAYIQPTANLINSLKDHRASNRNDKEGPKGNGPTHSTVEISAMARTYFGDVEDHILMMTDSLDTLRRSCDNMIDLIFNTIAAYQNESMKQLTVVTIIFLPLSFLTGYFGMNFIHMPSVNGGIPGGGNDTFFWKVAIPVSFLVVLYLMKDTIRWYFVRLMQKRSVSKSRKWRLSKEAAEKRRR
jgi:Mg2+ and Co2+ transporter CorA